MRILDFQMVVAIQSFWRKSIVTLRGNPDTRHWSKSIPNRDVQQHIQNLDAPDELHVDDETLEAAANHMVSGVSLMAVTAGQMMDANRQDQLVKRSKSVMSDYILRHPECNSYRGVQDMKESEDFKQLCIKSCVNILKAAG
jgi:hypothetical protein